MERQLFDWETWDEVEYGFNQYYNCTLKVPIGLLSRGDLVDAIAVDFNRGILEVYSDNQVVSGPHSLYMEIR
jgi:hypothetical protein